MTDLPDRVYLAECCKCGRGFAITQVCEECWQKQGKLSILNEIEKFMNDRFEFQGCITYGSFKDKINELKEGKK